MSLETKKDRIARMEREVIDLQLQYDTCAAADKFRIGVTLDMRKCSIDYVRTLNHAAYAMADLDTRLCERPQDVGLEWWDQVPPDVQPPAAN